MYRKIVGTTTCSLLLLAFAHSAFAQETTEVEKPKPNDAARAVQNIALAHELIEYGVRNNSPSSLITAAEILHANPLKHDAARILESEGKTEDAKDEEPNRNPGNTLAHAEAMIKKLGLKGYDGIVAETKKKIAAKPRGAYPSAVDWEGHLHRGDVARRRIHFHGHNHVSVHPDGYHGPGVDFDIRIVDRYGNVVREDRRPNANAEVHWDGDGDYWVEVRLHGVPHADFHLHTN